MKPLGLLGGVSWVSSQHYYGAINKIVQERLGGPHSAQIILYSFDFATMGPWDTIGDKKEEQMFVEAAKKLEYCGAKAVMICSNTSHRNAQAIEANLSIPLLHIADAAGKVLKAKGIAKIGILGTKLCMEEPSIIQERLAKASGGEVVCPPAPVVEEIHDLIFQELVKGIKSEKGRRIVQGAAKQLVKEFGCQAILLACTELGEVCPQSAESSIGAPIFDTCEIHALYAAEWMLE